MVASRLLTVNGVYIMAKRRMVAPDIHSDRHFLTATLLDRAIWTALIVSEADDEGRFVADPVSMCYRLFRPEIHQVTPEMVQHSLDWWAAADRLLLYQSRRQGDRYGFLLNWFAYQAIDRRLREASHLPDPPRNDIVTTWEQCDGVLRWYETRLSVAKTSAKIALSAFNAEPKKSRVAILRGIQGKSRSRVEREQNESITEGNLEVELEERNGGGCGKLGGKVDSQPSAAGTEDSVLAWATATATALGRPAEARQLRAYCRLHQVESDVRDEALALTEQAVAVGNVAKPVAYLQSVMVALQEGKHQAARVAQAGHEKRLVEACSYFLSMYERDLAFRGNLTACQRVLAESWGQATAESVVQKLQQEGRI